MKQARIVKVIETTVTAYLVTGELAEEHKHDNCQDIQQAVENHHVQANIPDGVGNLPPGINIQKIDSEHELKSHVDYQLTKDRSRPIPDISFPKGKRKL